MSYLNLTQANIGSEHICCAFSDKKCTDGYAGKKQWLSKEFDHGYVFRRLDARAKVFIEYGPAESAWVPVTAPNYLMLGCFWVSGRYKRNGHGQALLQDAVNAAKRAQMDGLVTVVGTRKFHFMSDTRWLLGQGFKECDRLPSGFSLVSLAFDGGGQKPVFNPSTRSGRCEVEKGLAAYYSDRCPYAGYYATQVLTETADQSGLPLHITKLETRQAAQSAPTPATIFSLFLDGEFVTTDISACKPGKFAKLLAKR